LTDQVLIQPGSQQWAAWREWLLARGGQEDLIARLDKAAAAGTPMRTIREWPTDEAREKADAAAAQPRKASTPLSEGAKWLGLYGSAEEPLLDAYSPLVKAGVRPSDTLLAVTTRSADRPFRETRWKAGDFLRKAPELRRGQHVMVEFQRGSEVKFVTAITHGPFVGKPDPLREENVIPFMLAHPLTRKSLIKWWIERTPHADEREAEAALRAMNPRELQNAVLLCDNDAARPMGNRHMVSYDPFASLFRRSQ
jgi:hypothetical protein